MRFNNELLQALQRHVDGCASRADVALLETAMHEDESFLEYVVAYLHLDAAMEEHAAAMPASRPLRTAQAWRRVLIPIAAAALIAVGGWRFFTSHSDLKPGIELVFVESAQAPWQAGERGTLRELRIEHGRVSFLLPNGVRMALDAPGELRFESAMLACLVRGRVTVDVGESGKGFALLTEHARVVDLGTSFGAELQDDGALNVVVFEGAVELRQPDGHPARNDSLLARLEAGQAVSLRAQRRLERLPWISSQEGGWSAQAPPATCAIRAVTDNLDSAAHGFFHRIEPGGMRPGAPAYVDKPHVWDAVSGRTFPEELMGADLVRSYRGARRSQHLHLEITVDRRAAIFVLVPANGNAPDWLATGYTRTEDTLVLRPDEDVQDRAMVFEVWRRELARAGVVTLGPPSRDAQGGPTAMYGVAVRAMEE
jgi:hypothetical protein